MATTSPPLKSVDSASIADDLADSIDTAQEVDSLYTRNKTVIKTAGIVTLIGAVAGAAFAAWKYTR